MAVKKVILNNETIIDISDTTATEADVASGKKFYKSNGQAAYGSATSSGGSVDGYSINYIDDQGQKMTVNGWECSIDRPWNGYMLRDFINSFFGNDNNEEKRLERYYELKNVNVENVSTHQQSIARFEEDSYDLGYYIENYGDVHPIINSVTVYNKDKEQLAGAEYIDADAQYMLYEPTINNAETATYLSELESKLRAEGFTTEQITALNLSDHVYVYNFVFEEYEEEEPIPTPEPTPSGDTVTTNGNEPIYVSDIMDYFNNYSGNELYTKINTYLSNKGYNGSEEYTHSSGTDIEGNSYTFKYEYRTQYNMGGSSYITVEKYDDATEIDPSFYEMGFSAIKGNIVYHEVSK